MHLHLCMKYLDIVHTPWSISCHVFDNCIESFHNQWCNYIGLLSIDLVELVQYLLEWEIAQFQSGSIPIPLVASYNQILSIDLSEEKLFGSEIWPLH